MLPFKGKAAPSLVPIKLSARDDILCFEIAFFLTTPNRPLLFDGIVV